MATGTSESSADNVEASSTEVMELIPGKIKATFAGDIYIKSDTEQNLLCNVIHLTCLDKNKIVVVDDASQFPFSDRGADIFRVKLVDTSRKQVVSVLDVPGKFSGMTTISDTQLALCVDGRKIILLRADKALTAERRVKLTGASVTSEITHLSTYRDDLYICNGRMISKVDMMGKTAQVYKSTATFETVSGGRNRTTTYQEFKSSAMYEDGDKTFIYAITDDDTDREPVRHRHSYLAHGTGKEGVMDEIKNLVPKEARSIVIDDEFELLFVLLYREFRRSILKHIRTRVLGYDDDNGDDNGEHYVIYALRPGTTDGCVLLDKADGLQDVTTMAYCSKTRQLFVGFKENNYVKVYQLSSVP